MKKTYLFQRIAVFVDYANINRSASDFGIQLDYADLLEYLTAGRHLVEAIAYVPIDPSLPHGRDAECDELWQARYFVKTKLGKRIGETFKCNVDVEMTIDMLNAALDMDIDTVVLVSGDGDFIPVVAYLRGRGIRVESCGFQANTARELVLKSSGYVDMEAYLDERFGEEPDTEHELEDEGEEIPVRSQLD
ncbi:NYN domain-containing protein [Roseovarius sp.]|uniref:LabA-like NYN domain-containing protein n=1 Tax=Roseovarius sp. TaxID=1486281 RepID=UPI003A98535C